MKLVRSQRVIIILAIILLLCAFVQNYQKLFRRKQVEGFANPKNKSSCKPGLSIEKEKKNIASSKAKCSSCRKSNKSKCGCESKCSSLLPVLDPLYNMREICKQSILLEDHLFQPQKRCHDCICKHFLTIEALAEEAITLDKEGVHSEDLEGLPTKIRGIHKRYLADNKKAHQAGQELRKIRKSLMIKSIDAF